MRMADKLSTGHVVPAHLIIVRGPGMCIDSLGEFSTNVFVLRVSVSIARYSFGRVTRADTKVHTAFYVSRQEPEATCQPPSSLYKRNLSHLHGVPAQQLYCVTRLESKQGLRDCPYGP